jgi:NAD(P)-dependent dehydrogenase (short-subunit alcohol dehydrogenase family)
MSHDWAGKVAIVTGGASGLGKARVERFAADGARVVIADVNRDTGEELAALIGEDALFHYTDVGEPDQIAGLVATAVATFGDLDIMVNNAAIAGGRVWNFLDDELIDFDRVIAVNLRGVMVGTRDAARHMAQRGGGSIINMSSIGGIEASPGGMPYGASKAAVIHFTKAAALALAQYEIRVNAIAPGHIRTPLLASSAPDLDPEDLERYEAEIRAIMRSLRPLQRDGTGADVASAAAYFAGDESRYVTGTVLPVDGGAMAGNTTKPPRFTPKGERK